MCEVRFLSWTSDRLRRQVAYEGLRGDKPGWGGKAAAPGLTSVSARTAPKRETLGLGGHGCRAGCNISGRSDHARANAAHGVFG